MNLNNIHAAQGAQGLARVRNPDIQQAINPIEEEPGILGQEKEKCPLVQREASLGFWTDEELQSQCLSLVFQLTDPMFTNEERMGNPLDIIKQSQELLNINTNEGTNILMASLSNEEFLKAIIPMYVELVEKDIGNACALCDVLTQRRADNGKTILSIAIESSNVQALQILSGVYAVLNRMSPTYQDNRFFREKYERLKRSHIEGLNLRERHPMEGRQVLCSSYLEYAILKAQIENNYLGNMDILSSTLNLYHILGGDVIELALARPKDPYFLCAAPVVHTLVQFAIANLDIRVASMVLDLLPAIPQGRVNQDIKKEAILSREKLFSHLNHGNHPPKSARKVAEEISE